MNSPRHGRSARFLRHFIEPAGILLLSAPQQSALVRRARVASLLGVLAHRVAAAGLWEQLPGPVRDHLRGGQVVARDYERVLRFETVELTRLLAALGGPVVFLKGAAYQLRDLPVARGRLASDVDVLVPADRLAAAERILAEAGWVAEKQDAYDQRYYREWMHELPPLRHHVRLTTVDLHHNILPRTSRCVPDAGRLLARCEAVGDAGAWTLAPEDMVLHNCVHLFIDGDLNNRVRELVDLDGLLRAFCVAPDFAERLIGRAGELGLGSALAYGLYFAGQLPDPPLAPHRCAALAGLAHRGPARRLVAAMMDRTLVPALPEEPGLGRRISADLLYLRSHWLRMPPGLLLRHLWHQARRRGGLKSAESAQAGL